MLFLVLLSGLFSGHAHALAPEDIALVVNAKVPASRELAESYAKGRGIPDGRIIALDLPFPEEEVPYARYDAEVVPALRKQLQESGLRDKVKCLVTFWGVPLRIGRRETTPEDQQQLAVIQRESDKAKADLTTAVGEAEALAKEVSPGFQPAAGSEPNQLAQRAGAAMTAALRGIAALPAGPKRSMLFNRLVPLLEQLAGRPETIERLATPDVAKLAERQVTPQQLDESRKQAAEYQKQFAELEKQPRSPQTFAAMRKVIAEHFGLFRYVVLLQAQQAAYDAKETESAFDSELALLWWDNNYARYRWQGNALHHRITRLPSGTPPTLMVTRLDGPTEQSVRHMIASSLKVEKEGLQGLVALDGRGMMGDDGYGRYDKSIRNLATMLKQKGGVAVVFDDRGELMQPAPEPLKGVALYCGWYSLRVYVPAFKFNEGAVGFHVASSELVSLRNPGERGWGANLIKDGVVATVGPVAEPYLHSFPPADEFFPLLLTGKLTLAEVYWKTNPMTSWMNTCIGDPLYKPYAVKPVLTVEDLPAQLRKAVDPEAVSPAATTLPPAAAPQPAPAAK